MSNTDGHFSDTFLRRVYIGLSILLIIAVLGIAMRIIENIKLRKETEELAISTVTTIAVGKGPVEDTIILPGNVIAWHDAKVYARTDGYVMKWYADIGTHVKAGDLLAEIATPEVDAQLLQTEAQLKTAEANYQLAKTTAVRWLNLVKTKSVSQQETDEKVSDEKSQAAIVASTKANRDRLRKLVSFEKVTAPFDGVIMSRTTDIGRLINAGSGATPLFRIVQSNRLRVYVRVPQNYSSQIRPEFVAQLHFAQHPGKVYSAKLLDTAKAIDVRSRTLLTQLELDNPNNELMAGSYTEAHFILPCPENAVRIPVNSLIFQKNGLQVAIVSHSNQVILKSITIGRDFGDEVEVVAGLNLSEKIILNPPDSLTSGQTVRIASSTQMTDEDKKNK